MPSPVPPALAPVVPLRPQEHQDAVRIAIAWLTERHRKGWRNAFDDWMERLRDGRNDEPNDHRPLDEGAVEMISINAGEWLLARGQINARGGLRNINAYLLSADGPDLTPGQQRWIAQLRERALRLYRVTEVQPGVGMTLVDEIDDAVPPWRVQERSGSRSANAGMLMGARIMPLDSGAVLSGAVYVFARLREAAVLERVRAALGAGLQAQNNLDLAEWVIAQEWLAQWFEPDPMPELRDAATGDPMLLVTDHYRVLDAAALAAALAAQADVNGSAEQGWSRDVDAGGGLRRSLATINRTARADRIEIFYRTQRLADAGRAWFDGLAGPAVQYLTREVTDPRSPAALAGSGQAGRSGRAGTSPNLPPADLTEMMTQFVRSHYAHWADEPIPALGDKTPRQAITTPSGLERVKGLLRLYEAGEADQAKDQGREAVSYQFLWDALGVERKPV